MCLFNKLKTISIKQKHILVTLLFLGKHNIYMAQWSFDIVFMNKHSILIIISVNVTIRLFNSSSLAAFIEVDAELSNQDWWNVNWYSF